MQYFPVCWSQFEIFPAWRFVLLPVGPSPTVCAENLPCRRRFRQAWALIPRLLSRVSLSESHEAVHIDEFCPTGKLRDPCRKGIGNPVDRLPRPWPASRPMPSCPRGLRRLRLPSIQQRRLNEQLEGSQQKRHWTERHSGYAESSSKSQQVVVPHHQSVHFLLIQCPSVDGCLREIHVIARDCLGIDIDIVDIVEGQGR